MKKILLTLTVFALPLIASAQDLGNIERIVESIGNIVDLATPIVVGIALLAFFWGLARFIFSADDEEARKESKHIMLWGVIALFVMVSVWGLVRFIGQAFNIEQGTTIEVPRVGN